MSAKAATFEVARLAQSAVFASETVFGAIGRTALVRAAGMEFARSVMPVLCSDIEEEWHVGQ